MNADITELLKESREFIGRIQLFEIPSDLEGYLNTVATILEYEEKENLEERHPQVIFLKDLALTYYFNQNQLSFNKWCLCVIKDLEARGASRSSINKHLKKWYLAAYSSVNDIIFERMDSAKFVRAFDLSSLALKTESK